MGSVPSPQTIEIDLNGTGTLVDVTAYVDQAEGIEHKWGRSDWTTPEPAPGSLSFTLENLDGRFTPGNTAVYDPGCVVGTLVQWTCGTRVRRFRMGVPTLAFPTGVAGLSLVHIEAFDALQLLAQKRMRTLLDETVLMSSPVAYWPLAEASPPAGVAATAIDASGNNEVALVPWGGADALEWAKGVGPAQDNKAALGIYDWYATAPGSNWAGLATDSTGLNSGWDWTNTGSAGTGYDAVGVSMWVKIKDVFGAANGAAATYAGPIVHLISVGSTEIYWDVPHRAIMVHDGTAGSSTSLALITNSPTIITPSVTHCLQFVIARKKTSSWVNIIDVWLDGTWFGWADLGTTAAMTLPGAVRIGGRTPGGGTIGSTSINGFAGIISGVAIHRPPGVRRDSGGGALGTRAAAVYAMGAGVTETSTARLARIGGVLGNSAVAFAAQGTSKTFDLSPQHTEGKSMLTALCDALRGEDAGLDTIVTGGTETVRAWMYGSRQALTPAITVNVSDDCIGVPELTFDSSGVAVDVTAKNDATGKQVVWRDTTAAARWQGTATDVACALASPVDMMELAQYRSLLGQITAVTPQTVVVDAVTSQADLTAALLALRPWVTVAVEGFPEAIVGYGAVHCYLAGVTERHSLGSATFTLSLLPALTVTSDTTTDPMLGTEGPWRISDFVAGNYAVSGAAGATLTSGATTIYLFTYLTDPSLPFLSTTAGDYPLDIKVDDEIMHCPNTASAPAVHSGNLYYQSLTGVTRGYADTTAVSHAYSSYQSLAIVNPSTSTGVHEDPYIMR